MSASGAPARLAVLGSPIVHSRSPELHRAAYDVLGLDWSYEAIEVAEGGLAAFLDGLDDAWRGLSLTMPLKREVLRLLDTRSELVDAVGAANTVLRADGALRGFNTDVPGIVAAFREAGVGRLDSVQILGAGATAASVIAAVGALGATRAMVWARDPARTGELERVAGTAGVALTVRPMGMQDRSLIVPDAVVSTLPGGAQTGLVFPERVRREAVLLDVAYDPWPSGLARAWGDAGGTVIAGLAMLLHQAFEQVRIFVTGREDGALEQPDRVLAAMRSAVGL